MAQRRKDPPKEHLRDINAGGVLLRGHPLFSRLAGDLDWRPVTNREVFGAHSYARLVSRPHRGRSADGFMTTIEANPWRRATPEEWAHVFGQALLHHYLCHADPTRRDEARQVACALVAEDFMAGVGLGRRPEALTTPDLPSLGRDLETIASTLRNDGDAMALYGGRGLAVEAPTFAFEGEMAPLPPAVRKQRQEVLAAAIRASVLDAIQKAGDAARGPATPARDPNSLAQRARAWFVAKYPLLGALAAAFDIVEDADLCDQFDISIAAVDSELRRVYINPRFAWTYGGMQFVMAHELLHVGLRHEARRQGRDPYLWNVACDYVINGWLVEMGVGEIPTETLLLDPELGFERESAEAIYDRIVGDLRLIRRLNKSRTLRGQGKVDMLGERPPGWWNGPGTDLDAFYRRALAEGLDLHVAHGGRGLLPGDLVEEIRAIQQRPIPWDVQLGQWMDAYFPPLEARRSYARAHRRQAATPDIPRPVWLRPEERLVTRTFGVVLDTSGSMSSRLLARALGAIAAYALSREVPAVRVLQCDAGVHDAGYVEPEHLLGRVEIHGRGGTVLQPAVNRLEGDERFPKDAPILIITDGACDPLTIRRDHAFLMPDGARLPFATRAPRFAFERDS